MKIILLFTMFLITSINAYASVAVEVQKPEDPTFEHGQNQEARGPMIIGNATTRSQGLSFAPMQEDDGPVLPLPLANSRPGQLLIKANMPKNREVELELRPCGNSNHNILGEYLQTEYADCGYSFEIKLNEVQNVLPGFYQLTIRNHDYSANNSYYPFYIEVRAGMQTKISLPVITTPDYAVSNGPQCLKVYPKLSSLIEQNKTLLRLWINGVNYYIWDRNSFKGLAKYDEKIRHLVRFESSNGVEDRYFLTYMNSPKPTAKASVPTYSYGGSKSQPSYQEKSEVDTSDKIEEAPYDSEPVVIMNFGEPFILPPGDYKMLVYVGFADCRSSSNDGGYIQSFSVPGVTAEDVGKIVPRE